MPSFSFSPTRFNGDSELMPLTFDFGTNSVITGLTSRRMAGFGFEPGRSNHGFWRSPLVGRDQDRETNRPVHHVLRHYDRYRVALRGAALA